MPTYQTLKQKHPDWDGPYWRRCKALYAGGRKLLNDPEVLHDVFPPHLAEKPHVYAERKKRAYYIPYAGEIIDMITSALFSELLVMSSEPKADQWYGKWADDVSPPGGQEQTLRQFLKQQVTTALVCKRAWTLIDMPAMEVDDVPTNLKEQEERGALDAYACALDPECVWDWETDREGKLIWVLVHYQSATRADLSGNRNLIKEEWVYYTRTDWKRYAIEYKKDNPPNPTDEIPEVKDGLHSFGEVPVIPLDLPEGLWAMGKIESIAVAHLNKRNALSWAQFKSLFPVMAHFAAPPDPLNPLSEDPNRATTQIVGQGHILQFAQGDEFKFVGPDSASYTVAQQDLRDLRDEMHRVVHQMANAVDNSAAALQRSAASKQVDQSAGQVVLQEFGKLTRAHSISMHDMAGKGRKEETDWTASGMDAYDEASADALVVQAQSLELVSIPSAKFQQLYKYEIARRVLGDQVEPEDLEEIKAELEGNITNEQFTLAQRAEEAAIDQLANPDPDPEADPNADPAAAKGAPAPKAKEKVPEAKPAKAKPKKSAKKK